jgi:hypothetical protein
MGIFRPGTLIAIGPSSATPRVATIPKENTMHAHKLASPIFVLVAMVALGSGCSGGSQGSEDVTASSSAAYSTGIDGCTLAAFTPGTTPGFGAPRAAGGVVSCPSWRSSRQLQVCMQQLVTGGWQTLQWTCSYTNSNQGFADTEISASVPYYTAGRWYRSWAWGDVDGANTAVVSAGCQGNGGSGCN